MINSVGTVAGNFADIAGNPPGIPVADQILLPGQTKNFRTFGAGWFVSREVFSLVHTIPLSEGIPDFDFGTGVAEWRPLPVFFPRWQALGAQKALFFPVNLPDGAVLTDVDVVLEMGAPAPVTRMQVSLIRNELDFTTLISSDVAVMAVVAPVVAPATRQKVSLTGMAEVITTGRSWVVLVESSSGVPVTQNQVYGVRLTYSL